MATLNDSEGRNLELVLDDYDYASIATIDFSPLEDVSPNISTAETNALIEKGFFVRPFTEGLIYGITWRQYKRNKESLIGLVPKKYYANANEWIPVRYIKIFHTGGTYATVCSEINYSIPC